MNSVILTGNLTKDPDIRTTNNGKMVASCSIAWNRGEEVSYFDCVAFDKKAELISDYCKKGNKILIRGELKQDVWQDKTGATNRATRILINEIEFLSKKEQNDANSTPAEPVEDTTVDENGLPF